MSRTTRYRPYWTKYHNYLCWCDFYPQEEIDPRDSFMNGRDGKPQSLLYEGRIKCPGWNRDFVSGPRSRREYKRIARRYRRREKISVEDYYD